ncbi:TetR/AcrR family transcriptional regulator [Paenibacillus nanensis]|uniref:TetR/AcrR family transcriptional regulator n=1 Tax=Paenibacillus nanensis TaxID=393251 RepID=A0A3A1URC3_9BACL|nr:TetR/AcrR family transcriptional regulator [Paenibacillus nanensis]RIX51058.1 TetR/AcrR family transcriptional regulator [Paenibacillus nanensis]
MNFKQKQTEITKARLLATAFAIFSQRGYHAASIEDIAAEAGISKANIYYHFKSKEGLFLALLDQHEVEWKKLWEEKRKSCDTVGEMLGQMIEASLTRGCHHPLSRAASEFTVEAWCNSEEGKLRIAEKTEEQRRLFNDLIQTGIQSGEFDPRINSVQVSFVLESLLRGMSEMVRQMEIQEALTLYRSALDVFLHGITQKNKQKETSLDMEDKKI